MDIDRASRICFSPDYATARARFIDACLVFGIAVESHENPRRGPAGEVLATDAAWIGPKHARHVVAMISGTHGVEGFCGGGAQLDWLLSGGAAALPRDTAVLLVHAANPFGWAWLSRTTEENVDLNRNWVDFSAPLPRNEGYDELAAHLVPAGIEGPAREAADAALAEWRRTRTPQQWLRAVSSGQYDHPHGLFFGGGGPTWARRTEEEIMDRHRLAQRDTVTVLDMHTGLGPFGYGEPISHMPQGSEARERVMATWGESVTEPARGTSVSTIRRGLSAFGWRDRLGERCVFVTFEFGTRTIDEVIDSLRGDCWSRRNGLDATDPVQRRMRATARRAFFPDSPDWNELVLARSRQVMRQALAWAGARR